MEERAKAFGAGLAKLGIDPGQESYVGIYCHNMVEVRGLSQDEGGAYGTERRVNGSTRASGVNSAPQQKPDEEIIVGFAP